MSEDEAYRRAKAARLVRQYPELFERIATGELHLTGLLLLGPHLDCERRREILDCARFRSKREIQELVARLDPKLEVGAGRADWSGSDGCCNTCSLRGGARWTRSIVARRGAARGLD